MDVSIGNDTFKLKAFDMWEKIDYSVEKNLDLNYEMKYKDCSHSPKNAHSGTTTFKEYVLFFQGVAHCLRRCTKYFKLEKFCLT